MLRFCALALMLMVSGGLAAPAPVFKPPKNPRTPFEAMLADLRKTGKATGPDLARGGTWTLTVEKIEAKLLKGVVLTYFDSDGKERSAITANGSSFPGENAKRGVFDMGLYGTYEKPAGQGLNFLGVELDLKPSAKP